MNDELSETILVYGSGLRMGFTIAIREITGQTDFGAYRSTGDLSRIPERFHKAAELIEAEVDDAIAKEKRLFVKNEESRAKQAATRKRNKGTTE